MSDNKKYNRIKEFLVKHDKSQKWLAEQLGKSQNSIAKICNNKAQPHIITLFEIARLLKENPGDLLAAPMNDPRFYIDEEKADLAFRMEMDRMDEEERKSKNEKR